MTLIQTEVAKPDTSTDVRVLQLPAECAIANAAELRALLLDAVDEQPSTTLDASAVRRIDTAGLQLLAAYVCERRSAARPVTWSGVPASLAERAALLGLHAALGFSTERT
jgi:anti-anti-sigma regulatory factor